MESSYLGIVFSSIWIVNCFCSTDFRNVTGTQPHAPKLVWMYPQSHNLQIEPHNSDNRAYYTNPTPSVSFATVGRSFKVVEPTKLATPQILYDFQRSHVEAPPILGKRPLQLSNATPGPVQNKQRISHRNIPNVLTSETIVNPIQTSNFFDQNIQHPLYNIQPQYYIPKKYALVNGKFVYDPKSLQLVQKPTLPTTYHSSQQFPQFPHPLAPHKLIPQPVPITRNPPIAQKSQFKAPPVSQFQPINTPSEQQVPARDEETVKEAEPTGDAESTGEEKPIRDEELTGDEELTRDEEPTREEKPVSENRDEEENEDNANYEEEDGEPEHYEAPDHYEAPEFEKYFNDDEDDHEHIESDDDDDDSDRGSTSFVPSRKYPKKYNYKSSDKKGEIIYGRKNERNEKPSQKPKNKEKMHYKSYRYSKDSAEYPEIIEGRQSEQVPVTHKQNILKEKWYVTKSSDNERFD